MTIGPRSRTPLGGRMKRGFGGGFTLSGLTTTGLPGFAAFAAFSFFGFGPFSFFFWPGGPPAPPPPRMRSPPASRGGGGGGPRGPADPARGAHTRPGDRAAAPWRAERSG